MDLQEEYFVRRAVLGHMIKFCERGNLILKAREGLQRKPEWNWLHVTIQQHNDGNHPVTYQFQVSANPVAHIGESSHTTYHPTKVVSDNRCEFDQFESWVLDWAAKHAIQYYAIDSTESIFVSWEIFCVTNDQWLASFLTWRMIDKLQMTFIGSKEERLKAIDEIESWIREKHERMYSCWKNAKVNLEQRSYADWLARVVNSIHDNRFTPWTKDQLPKPQPQGQRGQMFNAVPAQQI